MTIAEFLRASDRIDTADQRTFNGFSGLHGGLAVAKLVHQMRAVVPATAELVAVTARFIRPLVWPIVVDADVVKQGATITIASATASTATLSAGTSVEATATYGNGTASDAPTFAPEMPTDIVGRHDAPPLDFPSEFVPIFERMEIRPATDELPYSGSARPVLCGWVRLRDDVPVNDERIPILIDSLAPSYTAILSELKAVPTVEMSIQLAAGAADAAFDWALVRAETTSADSRGFVQETIDMWTEAGRHLASCTQLRIVR
ncbi:acyl-CoA thioesterase [Mycobacterium hubeiense]|uniref:acyl-CoA thioesterase n=1 Tax=Mycobacterium hubeiense TaxID=1867256 RepID=UPI001E330F3A|nr:thioesterase family protein [Mycobacterium sp. QGD 101]